MSSGISSLFLITDLGLESLDGSGSFFFGGGTFSAMVVPSSLLAFVGSNMGLSFSHLSSLLKRLFGVLLLVGRNAGVVVHIFILVSAFCFRLV